MCSSSWPSAIWPWATETRASGTSARMRSAVSSIVSTRLCRKNVWPWRASSRLIADATSSSSYSPT